MLKGAPFRFGHLDYQGCFIQGVVVYVNLHLKSFRDNKARSEKHK
jgi:hypothetical protein